MLVMQLLLRHLTEIAIHCHRLLGLARNPYRPELHYMRGPGPKWHAKHAQPAISAEPDLGGAVKIAA